MPTFSYSARPASGGEMQTGELDLPTREAVLAQLHRQKLIPVSVREKPKELSLSFGTGTPGFTSSDERARCISMQAASWLA